MTQTASVPIAEFEEFYASREDPYGFRTRWYERRKYALTLAALRRERYARAVEIGCAEGEFTRLLLPRAERVIAIDGSATALRRARDRVTSQAVEWVQAELPEGWPTAAGAGSDLIVLSEVGYFLTPSDLDRLVDDMLDALAPGGELVAVHWRPSSPNYPLAGDAVHARLREAVALRRMGCWVETDFLIEVWERQ